MSLTIAYLINQYPKVSHSFIRREITSLEKYGIKIQRFAIRSCGTELVDEADILELEKTQVVLGIGKIGLVVSLIRTAIARPIRFLQALWLALRVGWRSERGILYHLIYLAEACVLLGWWRKASIDHVHAHFGTNSTTVAMLCSAMGGPPYSFTIHGPEEFDSVQSLSLVEKVKRAAFVVTVSSFGKSQLYRWCDRSEWSKIHVVHCGVDDGFLDLTPTSIPSEPRFVCVARMSQAKGHLLLLDAAVQLAREGLQFKLVFIGDGLLRNEIENAIAQLGLQNYVELIGWASNGEVRQHILASRAMVLPSFAEGLPVVLMEALALSRPVISTYIAGIPELVEPGVCGWLVPPGSIEALVTAMREALQLPIEQLEHMGTKGRSRVIQKHNITIEAGNLAALFQSSNENLKTQEIDTPSTVDCLNNPNVEVKMLN
ncbi:glycosyltransferase [Chlorogloeopsis sp. ULAP02]|uniref:glycosyltransferase n=1 Tax=Chlorogloeopsis sp. ULAP02 TaxID=3107926 RepID=UPI00313625CB